jgi:hypothetical protein
MQYLDGLLAYRKRAVLTHGDMLGPSGPATRASPARNYPPPCTGNVTICVFNSFFLVNENLEAGASSVQGDSQGETWVDEWTFTSNCTLGPCATMLSGQVDGQSFTTQLKPAGDGTYTGTAQINDYYTCGSDANNYEGSTLYISIIPAAAHAVGNRWQVSKLTGAITWTIDYNSNGGCGGGSLTIGLTG